VNQRPLEEIVSEAVQRVRREEGAALDEEAVLERVLRDPDLTIILQGYEMHDRSEGLEDVMIRDIRRMVAQVLRSHS
jgi:hypothetical protein